MAPNIKVGPNTLQSTGRIDACFLTEYFADGLRMPFSPTKSTLPVLFKNEPPSF